MSGESNQEAYARELTEQIAKSEERRKYANERGFETVKHLTTLASGSVVLLATFLGDIFPTSREGVLIIGPFTKGSISAAFLCFVASLVTSCWFMYEFASAMNRPYLLTPLDQKEQDRLREIEQWYAEGGERSNLVPGNVEQARMSFLSDAATNKTETNVRLSYLVPFLFFVFGIIFLSIAVVISVI